MNILHKFYDIMYLMFHNLKSYSFSNIECNNEIVPRTSTPFTIK